jgi:eukaryotic-like serine/threonine-protein kinase
VSSISDAVTRLTIALADRYRLERELGQGGMATVYLAHDLKHDREVAIKVLRPELAAVLGPERFLAEIKITARLDHPHILTLIDSGASDGFLYYVLPFVRGESLRDKLNREKQLGLNEALTITKQVAAALDYAHHHGVVHRDIKPENILLHEGEAVLTDFGIALAVKEAGGNRLTETGISLGTPQYMSPEQATGDRHPDARSDVYSLAAVLYEMLAGEPPVTGPNVQAMIAKLMTERPTRLRVVRDTVPHGIDGAVARALSKVPADRFASAREFAQELSHPEGTASAQAETRRRWITIAMVGIVAVVLAMATWVALRGRPTVIPAFTPQYEQLTTDGNARSPAVSPDGTRLAYVARDCDDHERCTDRLVVRDIGGAGSITVLRGSGIDVHGWAADGRFLIAALTEPGGRSSIVAVSALGGTLWSLPGLVSGLVGVTDTVLISPGLLPPDDTVAWLRIVTVSDGLVRDSIALRRRAGIHVGIGIPAPVGGRIALARRTGSGFLIRLMDRSGRMTDSLSPISSRLRFLQWTPHADALLLQVDLGGSNSQFGGPVDPPVPSVVVRHRVRSDGKFVGTTDTLLTLEPGSQIAELRPDGSAVLSRERVEAVVYALERRGSGRLDFRSRRLTASTAGIQALLSRDGATVWLRRGGWGPGSPQRDAFVPFEGGSERPFTVPAGTDRYQRACCTRSATARAEPGWLSSKSRPVAREMRPSCPTGPIGSSRSRAGATGWRTPRLTRRGSLAGPGGPIRPGPCRLSRVVC